jgi:uncharacterized membrane protein YcaP (DUF421 family)
VSIVPRSWPTWAAMLIVVPVAYASLLVVLRLAGKRTLSKLTAYGLTVTVAFGSLLASVVVSRSLPLGDGILAFALLATLQWTVGWWSTRSSAVARIVTAQPSLLVARGQVDESALRRERLRIDDVRAAVRGAGHASVADVFAVVLETDGSLSVIERVADASRADAMDGVRGWSSP